jgi:hypothetical protein
VFDIEWEMMKEGMKLLSGQFDRDLFQRRRTIGFVYSLYKKVYEIIVGTGGKL